MKEKHNAKKTRQNLWTFAKYPLFEHQLCGKFVTLSSRSYPKFVHNWLGKSVTLLYSNWYFIYNQAVQASWQLFKFHNLVFFSFSILYYLKTKRCRKQHLSCIGQTPNDSVLIIIPSCTRGGYSKELHRCNRERIVGIVEFNWCTIHRDKETWSVSWKVTQLVM